MHDLSLLDKTNLGSTLKRSLEQGLWPACPGRGQRESGALAAGSALCPSGLCGSA